MSIDELNDYELIQCLQNTLISIATSKDWHCNYEYIRKIVLHHRNFDSNKIPQWFINCRDKEAFWQFIKNKFPHYDERREFIRDEFNPLLNELEFKDNSLPLEQTVKFDINIIQEQWRKAIERQQTDPEGAITMARTLLETLFKHILDELKQGYNEKDDLNKICKIVFENLNLTPNQHQEEIVKKILGGATGVVYGLGELRNKMSDAHGRTRNIKPEIRHGELAVNLAGSMAIFILKTFEKSKNKS